MKETSRQGDRRFKGVSEGEGLVHSGKVGKFQSQANSNLTEYQVQLPCFADAIPDVQTKGLPADPQHTGTLISWRSGRCSPLNHGRTRPAASSLEKVTIACQDPVVRLCPWKLIFELKKTCLGPSVAVGLLSGYLVFLSLPFLICQVGVIAVLTSVGCCEVPLPQLAVAS